MLVLSSRHSPIAHRCSMVIRLDLIRVFADETQFQDCGVRAEILGGMLRSAKPSRRS